MKESKRLVYDQTCPPRNDSRISSAGFPPYGAPQLALLAWRGRGRALKPCRWPTAMTRSTSTILSLAFVVVFGVSSMALYSKIMQHGTRLENVISRKVRCCREKGFQTC